MNVLQSSNLDVWTQGVVTPGVGSCLDEIWSGDGSGIELVNGGDERAEPVRVRGRLGAGVYNGLRVSVGDGDPWIIEPRADTVCDRLDGFTWKDAEVDDCLSVCALVVGNPE